MNQATVSLSLPPEQLELLTQVNEQLRMANDIANNKVWLSLDEVCIYLDVKQNTIRNWMKTKDFPYFILSKEIKRFSQESIDEWVKKHHAHDPSYAMKVHNRKRQAA